MAGTTCANWFAARSPHELPEASPASADVLIPIPTDYRNNESGRSVCLSVEPVMNERQDFGGRFPERSQRGRQGFFQSVQAGMTLIAGDILHLIPQPLDGIEFGAVRRQRQ